MNCPKCNKEISENDLICPNCKKVLKLRCQKCGHITKKSVCDRCGNTIINKCYKCGKLNSTSINICPSCGMNVNASILLREATIEEFASMTIELENYEAIQEAFNSEKLARHFRANFYGLIKKIGAEKKLRVQFIDNIFIIRFCKDYSFLESCISAVEFSLFVAQSVTEINKKLYDAKGIMVKAKIAIQKRDVYSKPSEYKSGVNINLVYSSKKIDQLFNNVQVLVDSYVYQMTKNKYPFQSLSAVYIKNQMVMFFELLLPSIIKIEEEEKIEGNYISLPKKLDFEPDETEDEQLINFSSMHCSFIKSKYDTLIDELARIINSDIKNPIVAVKSSLRAGNLSGLYISDFEKVFDNTKVCRFSCEYNTKYSPLCFLKDLLYSYTNVTELDVLLHPQYIDAITQDKYLQSLLLLKNQNNAHPEDVRYEYFESFAGFFSNIPEKTVFIVDNFENIDEGSLEILKYLIENNILGNVGFIFSYNSEFSLHRKVYKLITSPNFCEIELKLSSNKNIINNQSNSLQNIEKTFFFEKVIENTKGSNFFFNQAFNYLLDNGILSFKDGKYNVEKNKMIVIPNSIEELAKKRIQSLSSTKGLQELYAEMLLLGEKIPVEVLPLFKQEDVLKSLKRLIEIKLIQSVNDRYFYITNYNLYKHALLNLNALDKEKLAEVAQFLHENIIPNISIETKLKAEIAEAADNKKEAFSHWNKLAEIANSFGDFNTYLNCTNKYLSYADNVIDSEAEKTVEQIKMDVYEEISLLLYKYYPEKILSFLELLLENLEISGDDSKIKTVANKLVQSCLLSGNYVNALDYVGKIISRTKAGSFDPNDKNFSLNYFLINMVTLELYYNLGRLNECIELGDELFKNVHFNSFPEHLLPQGFSRKQFQEAIIDALFFISLSRIIQLKDNADEKISQIISFIPAQNTCFELLLILHKFLSGANISQELNSFENRDFSHDKYSQILYPILRGLIALKHRDWESLGDYIYQAKLVSNTFCLHQIEHFCDLMIGFAYQNMGNNKKAKQIYYNVLDLASSKGLKNITYLCWYLIAQSEFIDENKSTAAGILNNALLSMEKDENASEYFIMMFKTFYAELLLMNNEIEKALFCANQSFEIISRHKLGLNLSHVSNMLTEIYRWLMGNEKDPHAVEFYKQKLMQVAATNMQT